MKTIYTLSAALLLVILIFFSYISIHTYQNKQINISIQQNTQINKHILSHNDKYTQTLAKRSSGLLGCLFIFLFAYLLSSNRKRISWRLVFFGFSLQFSFAYIILKVPFCQKFFELCNNVILDLLHFTTEGTQFLFGNLTEKQLPVFNINNLTSEFTVNINATFAFSILPTIIFFSALTSILYHLKILKLFVDFISFVMQKTLKTSGPESFAAAANIFVGQTESPLLIRPFLKNMTDSEIMAIMSGGFATVAGGVMALYTDMLKDIFPNIAGHLFAASVMSAPASLVLAKMILPETETLSKKTEINIEKESQKEDDHTEEGPANIIDAAARGTTDGLSLALNIGAMLISFMALVGLLNWIVMSIGGIFSFNNLSLQSIFSYIFSPIAFLLGVPISDAKFIGSLLGTKTVINEIIAYNMLNEGINSGVIHDTKSIVIAVYALCGFSNFSSIGIQIGGLSALVPKKRRVISKLAFKAMIAGSLACFQTAAIAGILL